MHALNHGNDQGENTDVPATKTRAARGGTHDRYVEVAVALVREGRRPTVDLLVAQHGGSRNAAADALSHFWSTRLPALVAEAGSKHALPEKVAAAAMAMWNAALADGTAQALAETEQHRASLVAEKEALSAMREGLAADRAAQAERLREIEAELATAHRATGDAKQAAHDAEQKLQSALEQLDEHRKGNRLLSEQLDHARDDSERSRAAAEKAAADLQGAQERFEIQIGKLQAAAEQREVQLRADAERRVTDLTTANESKLDELKAVYHDSEQKLRVQLDAAMTEARKKSQSVELLQRELGEAKAQLALAATRPDSPKPWRRLKPKQRLHRGTK